MLAELADILASLQAPACDCWAWFVAFGLRRGGNGSDGPLAAPLKAGAPSPGREALGRCWGRLNCARLVWYCQAELSVLNGVPGQGWGGEHGDGDGWDNGGHRAQQTRQLPFRAGTGLVAGMRETHCTMSLPCQIGPFYCLPFPTSSIMEPWDRMSTREESTEGS